MSGDGKAQNPGASKPRERNDWLDVARGYGMFLVFYGHLIERFAALQLPTASVQFKFIYSFHMPLFFLIAGILARPLPGIVQTFQRGMLTRILPAVVFNLLVVPIWLSPSPLATSPHGQNIGANLMLLFQGRSTLNFLTWFLFCLFVVDLLHVALRRVIRRDVFVFASIIALFVFGQALTRNLGPVVRLTGVPANFWMVHEAVLALAFHQVGYLLRRRGLLEWRPSPMLLVLLCGWSWIGVAFTFGLNHGPFRTTSQVVVMALSSHGHFIYFPLTALLGCVGIATLSMLTQRFAAARWVGQRTLVFLGLNGFFFALNFYLLRPIVSMMPGPGVAQIAVITALTLLSMAVTAPVCVALLRWFPQLFGRPDAKGPILPALASR